MMLVLLKVPFSVENKPKGVPLVPKMLLSTIPLSPTPSLPVRCVRGHGHLQKLFPVCSTLCFLESVMPALLVRFFLQFVLISRNQTPGFLAVSFGRAHDSILGL